MVFSFHVPSGFFVANRATSPGWIWKWGTPDYPYKKLAMLRGSRGSTWPDLFLCASFILHRKRCLTHIYHTIKFQIRKNKMIYIYILVSLNRKKKTTTIHIYTERRHLGPDRKSWSECFDYVLSLVFTVEPFLCGFPCATPLVLIGVLSPCVLDSFIVFCLFLLLISQAVPCLDATCHLVAIIGI